MGDLIWVLAASIFFVCSHFLLSHPLRAPLVRALGEAAFQGVYSLIAVIGLAAMIYTYLRAPLSAPLWPVDDTLWAVATLIMLIASILLMGSLVRNPALPTGGLPGARPETARGVYAITRHPMLWSFALWGMCHIAVFPIAKSIVVTGAIIILALVGAALQDQKKQRLQPDFWPQWEAKTSYFPFAAILAGRARISGLGIHAIMGGLVVWLVATWAHMPIAEQAAGVWRWL